MAAYLAPFRALGSAPSPKPTVPKVRHVSSWMLRHPDDLDADEQVKLKQVLASCRHLEAAVEADDLPHLHRFVTGLRRDPVAQLRIGRR